MRFSIEINLRRLQFDPVQGRRTFYFSVAFGKRRLWLMRWDTNRCDGYRILARSRDGLMCWTAGIAR